ncbi:MAG: hypothetical protein WD716_11655 [Fimbriimonadaceae bacterium]
MSRLWPVLFALAALSACAKKDVQGGVNSQDPPPGVSIGRVLDPATRPLIEFDPFKGVDYVSVSEYDSQLEGAQNVTRVYRFSYGADFANEASRLKKHFLSMDGWVVESEQPLIIGHDYLSGDVGSYAYLIQPGRSVRDEDSYSKTQFINEEGYTRISLNEALAPKAKEPLDEIVVYSADHNEYELFDVPRSTAIESLDRSGDKLTVTFAAPPEVGDGSNRLLEIWLSDGSKHFVALVQLSKDIEALEGVSGLSLSAAVLLSAESVVRTLPVTRAGKRVTVVVGSRDLEPVIVISRWVPAIVPEHLVRPRVNHVRVSSLILKADAMPMPRPNIDRFYEPIIRQWQQSAEGK